jgi:hypothetical protein
MAGLVSNNINVAGFIERKTIHIIKELYYKTGTIREILRGTFFWFFGIMYNIKISVHSLRQYHRFYCSTTANLEVGNAVKVPVN